LDDDQDGWWVNVPAHPESRIVPDKGSVKWL